MKREKIGLVVVVVVVVVFRLAVFLPLSSFVKIFDFIRIIMNISAAR